MCKIYLRMERFQKGLITIIAICFLHIHVKADDDLIVKNASFEEKGNPVASWGIWPEILGKDERSVRLVENACDGVLAIEIKAASKPIGAQDSGNQWLVQDCRLPAKPEFILQVNAKGNGKGQMHVLFLDNQNQTIGKAIVAPFQAQAEYQHYDLLVQCPLGAIKMRVHLGAWAPNSTIIFDNLKVLDITSANQ